MRGCPLLLLGLAGCGGGGDDDVLASLAGTWNGSITVSGTAIPATAELTWSNDLLTGEVVVQDPPPEVPHTYAVRRWDVIRGEAWLDLTDVLDGTRALELDAGTADGLQYAGDAVVRYPCGQTAPCGYTGTFTFAAVPGDTAPPAATPRDTSR